MTQPLQSVLSVLYPPQCMGCGGRVAQTGGLCGACWGETGFITGTTCRRCGTPLPGDAPEDAPVECDDCLRIRRPWTSGAAAVVYKGAGRRIVMALKHGDRQDLVDPMAGWMADRLTLTLTPEDLVVPVPIHWVRMLRRRFNQSALLSGALAKRTGAQHLPDALTRLRHTAPQEGLGASERFALQSGTIAPNPRCALHIAGRRVLIVDDVMTSGATLAAAAAALHDAGARELHIVTFARVAKDV